MIIPVVDFSVYKENDPQTVVHLAKQIEHALTEIGFVSFSHIGIDADLLNRTFAASQSFFSKPLAEKNNMAYQDPEANFGYQQMQMERLTPSGLPDLKESLTLRNLLANQSALCLEDEIKYTLIEFYQATMRCAHQIQRVFSHILKVDSEYFVQRHTGKCATLRLLHYPPVMNQDANQFGAGEHTDYGMMTLLFQDDVGGLEVQDAAGHWHAVAPVPEQVVINCGDLMQRWTNDRFRSTTHRVQANKKARSRYSIALFVDPDPNVLVECLPACVSNERPARYSATAAGAFIQAKIKATH